MHSLSVAEEVPSTLEDIRAAAIALAPKRGSFKVSTNRADKRFPLHSMDLSAEIGGDVLENNSALTVNLHNPDHVINIDIRENGKTFVFRDVIRGVNGMPVGTGGKAVAMLSGGIDSPVAMYMMAKEVCRCARCISTVSPTQAHRQNKRCLTLPQ